MDNHIGQNAIDPNYLTVDQWVNFVKIETAFLGEYGLRLKIASDRDDTAWLKITPEQLNKIEKILTGEDE